MYRLSCSVLLALFLAAPATPAAEKPTELESVQQKLSGTVIDHTHNNGVDRRIWSPALKEKRDLYVYLPPGFDPHQRYPLFLYLHGYVLDESSFLKYQVPLIDRAIVNGQLPPVIFACPDGSIRGRPSFFHSASFYANSLAGNFEDYLMCDVWDFIHQHYPIRPEREAHGLVGGSAGGGAAIHLAIAYQDRIKIAVGFLPMVNMRWVDCHDRYRSDFDPNCWGWRTKLRPHEVLGLFFGVIPGRFKVLFDPVIGRGPDALEKLSRINPIESLDRYDLRPGQLDLYIAYAGKDEFNIAAQAESFLFKARQRGLCVGVGYDPEGNHSLATGAKLFPGFVDWVAPLVAPYSPPVEKRPVLENH